jgi:hypothetical protein
VSVNGTLVEAKMCIFILDSTDLIFNKCPIYTYDGASAKFSTNSHETDYSEAEKNPVCANSLIVVLLCGCAALQRRKYRGEE